MFQPLGHALELLQPETCVDVFRQTRKRSPPERVANRPDPTALRAELLRPRLLLINALENQARRRPDIVREYLDKLALLQQQHALPPGTGSALVDKGVVVVREKALT